MLLITLISLRPTSEREMALTAAVDDLCHRMDERRGQREEGLVLLDPLETFKTTSHGILLDCLSSLGLEGLQWFWSFLDGCCQMVIVLRESCSAL